MATVKFLAESPYINNSSRKHDDSDYKYQEYTENVSCKQLSSSQPVRLAIFGLGRAGCIHLSNIIANPRVKVVYIVEADQTKWEPVRTRWSLESTKFVHPDNADAVYKDPDVDACLISTPTFTHEEFIVGSLEAGKAVFSEKPIAEAPSGTARCYKKADEVGKPLFCAFNRRFDPSFASIRAKVHNGEVGHVQMIKTTSRDSPLPSIEYLKISGGIFHDCAVHDIDLVTWIIGEYPAKVYVSATSLIPEIKAINDHDNVAITLTFPSGTIACIDLSRFACYGYDQRLEVFGAKGMLEAKNQLPHSSVQYDISSTSEVPMYYSFPSRHSDGYKNELNHFLDVVQNNAKMSVTDRMTSAVSKIADACEESARSGETIALTWTEDELPEGVSFKA